MVGFLNALLTKERLWFMSRKHQKKPQQPQTGGYFTEERNEGKQ